ncbi:MAG: hypothetical protein DMG58_07210 [Acidobacteria bacterium]|nr:MAG: hypothetical protein DMG58_07210 [Acidobacteriota bacterium]
MAAVAKRARDIADQCCHDFGGNRNRHEANSVRKGFQPWAGFCPGNNRSAGKNKSCHSAGGNRWLRSALTECAWAASAKKNCFLREKFWRITTRVWR